MIEAIYIGENFDSFERGKKYFLKELNKPDWKILVENYYDWSKWRSYLTVEDFLKDWYVLKVT